MNERILELADKAIEDMPGAWNIPDEFCKKFAELIVWECADVALEQKKLVEDQEVFNTHDEQWNRARIQQSQRIVDKIKQHFGVEE